MTGTCPTCRRSHLREVGNKLWPFCSERCHLIDLGRWLGEEYRIADEPDTSGGGIESTTPPTEGES